MKTFKHFREDLKQACWKGYQAIGMKTKNGKKVPNCVPVKEAANAAQQAAIAIAMKKAGKKPKNEEVEQIEEEEARRPTDAEYEHAKKQVQKTFGNDRRIHAIGVIGDRIHLKHGTKNATDMKGVSMRLPEEVEQLDERGEDSKGYKRSTESGAGLTRKGAKHFGIKTAVTTPPSKLDPNGKAAKRRKSFCARMSGMRGPMKDEKGRPTRKAMSLRRWHCEE